MLRLRLPRTPGEPGTAQRALTDLSDRLVLAAVHAGSYRTSRGRGLLDAAAMIADQAAMVEDFDDDSIVHVELSDVARRLTSYADVLLDRARADGLYTAARAARNARSVSLAVA